MPSINPTLTGNGFADISGGSSLLILELAPKVTIKGGLVRVEGQVWHQRLHQVGWYGLGYYGGGTGPDLISWSQFVRLDYEDFRLGPNIFAAQYFWDLSIGTTIELEIDW